jgi:transketolase
MFKSLYEKSPLSIEHKNAPHYPLELTIGGKKLTFANPKAIRSYLLIMDQFAVNGGSACHWGGPSGITELATALYTYFFEQKNWTQNFNFVNDIGHAENAFYSLKSLWEVGGLKTADLQGFRSISSKLTGHGESHLYPDGVLLSNGPLSSALPQAQGLAIADKLIGNNRTTITLLSDGASMEGEAKEAFAAIPGLASKNKINPFVMIISDNNTKLTGRIDEDSFSQKNNFLALEKIGWKLIHVEDGHSIEACYKNLTEAVEQAKSSPVCIILKTVKGKGIKETEDAKSGGHGFPLKSYDEKLLTFLTEIWGSEKVPAEITTFAQKALVKPAAKDSSAPVPKVKIQDGVSKALNEMREKGFPVVSLSSDLQGSTGVAGFHKKHPESAIDLGIAESNMVSAAAGLSKAGLISCRGHLCCLWNYQR